MPDYSVVNAPGGMSYAAPLVDFGIIGNLGNTYYQGQQNRREKEVAEAFKNQPIPLDANGLPDYGKIMQVLASKGGIDAITKLAPSATEQSLINRAGQMSPLLTGGMGVAPAQGGPASPTPGPASGVSAPQSLPAPPASAPSPNYVQGGDNKGSVVDLVASKLPQDSAATGAVITNIARAVGVDPNAALSPEQSTRVARLVDGYVARTGGRTQPAGTAAAPSGQPLTTDRLVQAGLSPERMQNLGIAGPPASAAVADRFAPVAGSVPQHPPPPPPSAGAPAAPPQAQPIVPQVPLPKGFTDPQQAIMALRTEAAKLSTNPYAAGQVKELNGWADRIEASLAPIKMGQADTIMSPKGEVLARGPMAEALASGSSLLDPKTIEFMAQQYRAGDTSVLQNLGRGAQGSQNIVALRKEVMRQNQAEGATGSDQALRNAEYFGTKAGERTLGTRQANIELAATEFKQVIPVVRQASAAVNRTNYPDLNRIIQAFEQKTGDPNIVAFGGGVNTLINLYARAISPSGTPTVSDKEHAREILGRAWSQGQFDAAVGMMEKEIDAALTSPGKVREEMRKRFLGGSEPVGGPGGGPAPAAERGGTPNAGNTVVRWERGPDGNLRPAQ